MTSVNKIKELAAAHEYELAEGILDSQDLEKSYNPQFLRVCGEIYENVGRMREARYYYVKAHSMAPEATRIIYSLINYYLKVGYFELAERYFEEYIYYSNGDDRELKNIRYIMKKAKKPDLLELYDMIYPYYRDNMDIEWSYELLTLSRLLDKEDIDVIANDYKATFKTSPYLSLIDSAKAEKLQAWDSFFIYAEEEAKDDKPEDEPARIIEKEQLRIDYLKMNPQEGENEAVITSMVSGEEESGSIKSLNDVEKGLKSLIKKKFKKKEASEESDNESEEAKKEAEGTGSDTDKDGTADTVSDSAKDNEQSNDNTSEASAGSNEDVTITDVSSDVAESEEAAGTEGEDEYQYRDFVTYNYDDGFAPESDTISGLSEVDMDFDEDEETENVFKDFAAFRESMPDLEPEPEEEFEDEYEDEYEDEDSFEPEVEEDFEPEEEYEDEPITYKSEPEPEPEPVVEEETFEPEVEEDFEPEEEYEEEPVTYEPEPEPVVERTYEPEPEPVVERTYEPEPEPVVERTYEPEPVVEEEETFEPEVEEDFEPEEEYEEEPVTYEPEPEPVVERTYEPEPEPVVERTYEPEPEPVVERTYEPEPEPVVERTYEPEPEPVYERSYESEPEPVREPEPETEIIDDLSLPIPVPSYMKDFPRMDFGAFSSDLFPTLGKEEKTIENKFDKVKTVEQSKIDEGLKEEEEKLKEAEALLASLGIKL
ncbi:MAG: hypothetical protein J5517_03355 [Eubacterium sp.]|nr:hypothetical protein [Eubacterium sp.]